MADRIPQSGKIGERLYLLNLGFVCMYLLDSGNELIAFDTGMRESSLRAQFAALGLDPARVGRVFLTHSDRDHVGGLALFPNAAVYLPRAELAMVDRTTPRFFSFVYNKPLTRSFEPLDDEQLLEIGESSIRCIATPGHTAGHMSYLAEGRVLIAGDILNLKEGRAVLDRRAINIDNEARRRSIERLAGLRGVELLCPMHSGYSSDFELAMKEWK